MSAEPVLTTVVGSYPQPGWLVDRERLRNRPPPRVQAPDFWKVEPSLLEEAQDSATLTAIRDMESAGVDIISDGEIRRESYSNKFATALEGMDVHDPGVIIGRTGRPVQVPRVTGRLHWRGPVLLKDAEFLRSNTSRLTKATIPGPFTITQQAKNEFYPDEASLAMDAAAAVNREAKALKAGGIDVIQLDEPYLQVAPDKAKGYAVQAINRALEGVGGLRAVHTCFGYGYMVKNKPNGYPFLEELGGCDAEQISLETAQPNLDPAMLESLRGKTIIFGVINLGDTTIEKPEQIAGRILKALPFVDPGKLIVAPDCGMKYLDRAVALAKLQAMVQGTRLALGRNPA